MQNIIHKVYVDMYRQELYITFSPKSFTRLTGHTLPDHVGGCVSNGKNFTLWLELDEEGKLNMSNVAHEAFHVCDFIADRVGLVLSEDTGNEHFAYLTGWIVEAILYAHENEMKWREIK